MRLQLDTTGIQGAGAAYGAESGSVRRDAASQAKTSGDSVGLTGVSRALQTDAANHSARLAALTAAVRGGSYSVSGANISQAIVSSAGG
jgi:anti-sigma28 factor (negative regulator of flagellin synthesis)